MEHMMEVFDKVSQKTIDRRDQQLSFLALIMVVILGGGMALLMYPTVFGRAAVIPVAPSKTLFFGFCALCILMVMYLVNRMRVVKNLRASLVEEREQLALILQQSSAELLGTIMGFSHFQDRLTMDFRRAAQVNEPLSLLLVHVKPAKMFAGGPQGEVALGDAAKVLSRKLRREDSLYRLSTDVFGIMLPGASDEVARQTANRLSEGLADAAGASNRYTTEIQVVNYPEHVKAASEMERRASAITNTE
jgi:GGDEF domain-containing protein